MHIWNFFLKIFINTRLYYSLGGVVLHIQRISLTAIWALVTSIYANVYTFLLSLTSYRVTLANTVSREFSSVRFSSVTRSDRSFYPAFSRVFFWNDDGILASSSAVMNASGFRLGVSLWFRWELVDWGGRRARHSARKTRWFCVWFVRQSPSRGMSCGRNQL